LKPPSQTRSVFSLYFSSSFYPGFSIPPLLFSPEVNSTPCLWIHNDTLPFLVKHPQLKVYFPRPRPSSARSVFLFKSEQGPSMGCVRFGFRFTLLTGRHYSFPRVPSDRVAIFHLPFFHLCCSGAFFASPPPKTCSDYW